MNNTPISLSLNFIGPQKPSCTVCNKPSVKPSTMAMLTIFKD